MPVIPQGLRADLPVRRPALQRRTRHSSRQNPSIRLVILVSFYSLLPIKTTPESREECEVVSGFDRTGFGDLGVDTNILIEVTHDVALDCFISR